MLDMDEIQLVYLIIQYDEDNYYQLSLLFDDDILKKKTRKSLLNNLSQTFQFQFDAIVHHQHVLLILRNFHLNFSQFLL
jgi:hypothetical protein